MFLCLCISSYNIYNIHILCKNELLYKSSNIKMQMHFYIKETL